VLLNALSGDASVIADELDNENAANLFTEISYLVNKKCLVRRHPNTTGSDG
jgi:hypothetical protein